MWKKETFPEISINCYNKPPATLVSIQDRFYWLEAREVVYVTCGMGASRESGTRPILQKSCLLRKFKFSHRIGHISCAM